MSVAIVGPGMIGAAHAAAWHAAGAEVSYLVSRRPDAALEGAPNARTVSDLAVVLADPEVDVVTICTPTPTHREFAVACLRAGKNVLLEKPIALTLEDAEAITHEADAADGVLMVAHVVRFFDGYARVRRVVEAGGVGHPLHVRAERAIAPPDTPWWYDESQSGGVVVDLGIHDLDQANLLLGDPVAVRATATDTLGPVETTVRYAGGGLAQVLSHARMPLQTPFATSIRVLGDAGIAEQHHIGGEHPLDAFSLRSADGSVVDESVVDGVRAFLRSEASDAPGPTGVSGSTASPVLRNAQAEAQTDPYAAQAAHFLECVASGHPSEVAPTADAVTALRTALAARDSLRADGAWVRLG